MSKSNSDEIREQLNHLMNLAEPYMNRDGAGLDEDWQEFIAEVQKTDKLIQSEISKREQLLLSGLVKKAVYYTADKLEADGLDKWAVPVSFINAKRGKK